ncbi:MAG: YHYH protein [Opitutaceae bacterium]
MHTIPRLLTYFAFIGGLTGSFAQTPADPLITTWLTIASGEYARIYESDAAKNAGTASTTWSRGAGVQSTVVYGGVSQVQYSDNWVYLRTTGLGYHVMGPWYSDTAKTIDFPSYPANSNTVYRIPRTPSVPATKTLTNSGEIGYFVDGVAMYDFTDTFSYSTANKADASPIAGFVGRGDGVWIRDAYVNESNTFDPAFAHQAGARYHYHANAPALRYLLGDHVDYNAATKLYTESTTTATQHSPILGWVRDGHPLYGPYGYASAMDSTSGIRRMISGYVKRDGANGTTNLAVTGRTTLPTWAVTAQNRTSSTLPATSYGPDVNAPFTLNTTIEAYVLGHYLEDHDYLGNLGKTQGTDFDLDLYNGRYCVTPEFPNGTYAYFLSIESDGTPKYPYILGRWFYGSPTGDLVTSISETVTEYDRGAPAEAITLTGTTGVDTVTLRWNSAEGATYKMESSNNGSSWTLLSSTITSGGISTTYATPLASYYRVTLTAIATYDTTATVGTPVGTTATLQYVTSGSSATGDRSAATTTTTTTTSTTTPSTTTGSSTTTGTTSSGSGGGGAPSHWFMGALAAVALMRWRLRHHG